MSVSRQKKLIIKSDDEQFVMGEVIRPGDKDVQGDIFTEEAVKRFAHRFMAKRDIPTDGEHDHVPRDVHIAEGFVVRGDNDPDGFAKGAFVVGAYIRDIGEWAKIRKGDYNGFSFEGEGSVTPAKGLVLRPVRMTGTTESTFLKSDIFGEIQEHSHDLDAAVGPDGRFILGQHTGPGPDGHVHSLHRMGGTGTTLGHGHRIVQE